MADLIDADAEERLRQTIAGQTIPGLFSATAARLGNAPAHRWKTDDGWSSVSWSDYADRAARTAAYLEALGIGRGDNVALMLGNRWEFHPIDMGISVRGAIPVSIYNSSSVDQITYQLGHSAARLAIVEPAFELALRAACARLDHPPKVLVVGSPAGDGWEDVIGEASPIDFAAAASELDPSDVLTMIYTSGTTGPPKAVMLSHTNACALIESMVQALGFRLDGARMISYLPMAHIAERVVSHYIGAREGATVTQCPRPAEVDAYLPETQPEMIFAPPRVFDRLRHRLMTEETLTPVAAARLERALGIGRAVADHRLAGDSAPPDLERAWSEVDTELMHSMRERVGLGACRAAITGAAPVARDMVEFFTSIGVALTEAYGLSENTGTICADPQHPRIGTVGRPLPGCSVRLLDDGEILCRGAHVFVGYYKDPERTAEVLDPEGWLRTGDIGVIEEGYVRIVDRKKELIITAGGKNISPANLEAELKRLPLVAEACIVGDGRPYLTAILTLDAVATARWADENGLAGQPLELLANNPQLRAVLDAQVGTVNGRVSTAEQLKLFHVTADQWTPDSDVLTPTMKLKRRGVLERYADAIDGMYAAAR